MNKFEKDGIIYFDEGYTLYQFPIFLILIVIGISGMFLIWYIGLLLFLLSFLFLLYKTGIAIDTKNRKISRYNEIFGKRSYTWHDLNNVEEVFIDFEQDSSKMNSRGSSLTTQLKLYPMYFIEHKKVKFFEFTDHQYAIKVAKVLIEHFNMKVEDTYTNIQRSIQKRGRRR